VGKTAIMYQLFSVTEIKLFIYRFLVVLYSF